MFKVFYVTKFKSILTELFQYEVLFSSYTQNGIKWYVESFFRLCKEKSHRLRRRHIYLVSWAIQQQHTYSAFYKLPFSLTNNNLLFIYCSEIRMLSILIDFVFSWIHLKISWKKKHSRGTELLLFHRNTFYQMWLIDVLMLTEIFK